MNNMLKYTILLLLTITTIFAEDNKPIQIDESKLLGTWEQKRENKTMSFKGHTIYKEDGIILAKLTITTAESTQITEASGTWKINDNVVTYTFLKSTNPKFIPIKKTFKDTVIELTDSKCKTKSSSGNLSTSSKVLEKKDTTKDKPQKANKAQ